MAKSNAKEVDVSIFRVFTAENREIPFGNERKKKTKNVHTKIGLVNQCGGVDVRECEAVQ